MTVHEDRHGPVKTKGPNRLLTIHTSEGSEGINSAEHLIAYMSQPGDRPLPNGGVYGSSYQVVLDTDRWIQAVPDNVVAYSAAGGNHDGIHICFPGVARQPRSAWLDAVSRAYIFQAALCLVAKSGQHGIPLTRLSPDQVRSDAWGVCDHYAITLAYGLSDHTDVGPFFPWDVLFADINAILNPEEDDMKRTPVNPPNRFFDTINGVGTTKGKVDGEREVKVPYGAGAQYAELVITCTDAAADGFVQVWESGARGSGSVQNFQAATTKSRNSIAQAMNVDLDAAGRFRLYTNQAANVLIDLRAIVS